MRKADTEQFSDEETAQRRDEIVRAMANTPPQPRAAKRLAKPREMAAPTASDRKPWASDASAKDDAAA